MTNSEANSSQTPVQNNPISPENTPAHEGSKISKVKEFLSIFSDLNNAIQSIATILILVAIPIVFFVFRSQVIAETTCLKPSNPSEILTILAGTVGLTILGVSLAPAVILGIALWLVIKLGYFCG